ncbi:hypothetical protein [Dactylosporangium sp. NPDC051541]|uniref:hypothetical protein n=1 Tax=Dactylosporangium sp. NPDC051541 TaxID=3363977 RepID=UPI0037B0557D
MRLQLLLTGAAAAVLTLPAATASAEPAANAETTANVNTTTNVNATGNAAATTNAVTTANATSPTSDTTANAEATGTTYYLDAQAGDDTADGQAGHPWRTLDKVADTEFHPGDTLLLHAGQT